MRKLISVAIPAYNESDCVDELATRLAVVFDSLAERYDFEAIICENGSADDTYEKLLAINERDPRFKVVQLAHNFGMEGAVAAALTCAKGDAAVVMTADLQDPPEFIPNLIARWEEGYDNVYTVITKRRDEPRARRFLTAVYYMLLKRVSQGTVPAQASDFRLVDRYVYEAFNNVAHRFRMNRIVWTWLAARSIGVEYERESRGGGRSSFRYVQAFFWGFRTLLSIARAPLRWVSPLGLLLAFAAFLLLIGDVVRAFVWGVPFNGFGTLVGLDLGLFGFLFLLLGMMSEYLDMIFHEVRAMPVFVVRKKIGVDEEHASERAMLHAEAPHRKELTKH